MSGHEILWRFDRECVTALAVCNEPVGSDCRLVPIKDSVLCVCDEWIGIERDADGPYHVAIGSIGDEKHRMEDGGECNIALFLNMSELIEESAVDRPTFEIGRTPFEPVWQGDYYDWKRIEVTA